MRKFTFKNGEAPFISDETLNQMQANIEEATDGRMGDEYLNTSTYNIGDYCIYDNLLYKCITAVTTSENFNSTKWQKTTIANELKNRLEFEVIEEITTTEVISE